MKIDGINTTKLLLYITLIGILVILVFAFIIFFNNNFQFSSKSIMTLLGIIISCASLIITAYFVVMAINAYGHIEKIEELEKNVANTSQVIQSQRINDIANIYTIADNTKNSSLNKKLQLHEYRIAYINPESYDEETRIRYLLDLANIGDVSDIKPIDEISKNRKESQIIRTTAIEVVKDLRRRFPDA